MSAEGWVLLGASLEVGCCDGLEVGVWLGTASGSAAMFRLSNLVWHSICCKSLAGSMSMSEAGEGEGEEEGGTLSDMGLADEECGGAC